MATTSTAFYLSGRKDWPTALSAVRRLLSDANDTVQVFRIMRALNVSAVKSGYERLLTTPEGGRIAYRRVELAERLSDPDYIGRFPGGTLGAAYRDFLEQTGYSAEALAAVSQSVDPMRTAEHPYAWFGRRTRDTHDIWHILTGYSADDPLGEACLTAFSFAQTGGLGWALIAGASALRGLFTPRGTKVARAIWEGYRIGRRSTWLAGEDYETLLAEPLDEVRSRLGITKPVTYQALKEAGITGSAFKLPAR